MEPIAISSASIASASARIGLHLEAGDEPAHERHVVALGYLGGTSEHLVVLGLPEHDRIRDDRAKRRCDHLDGLDDAKEDDARALLLSELYAGLDGGLGGR